MKRKITLLLLAAASALTMNSQVLLNEEFTEPFNLAGSGWSVQNLSTNPGTLSWTQGNQTGGNGTSNAYSGGANDFYCADFLSIASGGAGDISAWLITPTLTLYNGAVLQFATRTLSFSPANTFPDRLQVRLAQSTNTTITGGATGVGTFTNLLMDINPNLSTNNSSVTVGSNPITVNGYPMSWTVYSVTVSGITGGTVTGRFAFRYFVTNGGQNGANSRFVGIDAVKYTAPCGPTVASFTTCPNTGVVLTALNGLPATTYAWTNSANANTYTGSVVNFTTSSSTTVFSLQPSVNGTLSCGTTVTATVTINSNVGSMALTSSAPTNTVCAGTVVTLTALDATNTYTWSTGSNNAAITVTANATTTYSVGSATGTFPNLCVAGNSITINVLANPTLSISYDQNSLFCSGGHFTVNASGANTYTYVFSSFSSVNNPLAVNLGTTTTGGVGQYIVAGTGTNGCVTAGLAQYTVNPPPSVSVSGAISSGNGTVACRGTVVNLTASGADTYSWTGAGITSAIAQDNPLAYTTSTATGNRTLTVIGTSAEGCTATASYVFGTSPCIGIEKIDGNAEASIYPNPFANELRLSGISGSVEIYNALGQMVVKTLVKNSEETINTTDLTKGVYIIKTYNAAGDLSKTVKLLKN